jgi:hypothetical protein
VDPELTQREMRKQHRLGKEGRQAREEMAACLPTCPSVGGYLGNAAGPAAGQQLTCGAEAVLIEAGR